MPRFAAPLALVAALIGTAVPAAGQTTARWDSTENVLPARTLDTIRAERESYARLRGDADARAGTARLRLAEMEDQVEQIKAALAAVDARIKTAKDGKNEPDKVVAEAEKKRIERQRSVMERRRDLRTAEMEEARAEAEAAVAATRALDLEYQLARRRLDVADAAVLADLEKKTLEARVDWASRDADLAGRRGRVVERRLSLLEAQQALVKNR